MIYDVFPTLVGMFRCSRRWQYDLRRFPHARGDVPFIVGSVEALSEFSPRARGDVPQLTDGLGERQPFSPRSWGCSGVLRVLPERHGVSPTPVGMFRMCAGRGINRVAPVDTVALVQVMARPWGLVVHGGHHRLTSICQWR